MATRGPKLAFASPPIWEVGISVTARTPSVFNPYDIKGVHELFRDRFPTAEKREPFIGSVPFPAPNAKLEQPTIQIAQPPNWSRWWFVAEDSSDLVQVQENMVARNWRRLSPPPVPTANPYPGFDTIFADFRDAVEALARYNAEGGRTMAEPLVCELLYDNLIPLGSMRFSEAIAPITFDPPLRSSALNLSWMEHIGRGVPEDHLTLLVTIANVGIDLPEAAGLSYARLTFAARNPVESWDDTFDFIESAHETLRERLVALTTENCRATWGPR